MSFLVRLIGRRGSKKRREKEEYINTFYGKFYSNPFYTGEAMGIKGGRAKGRRLAEKKKGEKVNV